MPSGDSEGTENTINMNYLIIENYINVKEFVAIGDSYYSIDKNNDLYFNDLEIENGIYGISKQNNLIFAYTLDRENSVTTILLDKNSFIAEINIPLLSNLYDGTTTLFGYDYEPIDSSRKYGVYDLKLNKIVLELKNRYAIGQSVRFGNFVLYKNLAPFIYCLDIDSDSVIWQFAIKEIGKYKDFDAYFNPIEKEGEVRKIIGIFNEVLVAQISGGENANENQLLGLNIQTGKQEWIISGISGVCANLQANSTQTHLLSIRNKEFIEIDLKTAQISRNKDLESTLTFQGKTITVKCMIIKDQHIFFTGSFSGQVFHSGVIGAFNIETEQLDWLHDMEFDRNTNFNMSSTPQIEGNRLYALDSGGTLHIFERDY